MTEMVVHRVVFSQQGQALVLLADLEGERLLPIWIGLSEANAIAMKLQDEEFERPLTHDLLANVITQVGYRFTQLDVTKLEEGVFYALIHLTNGEQTLVIDSRPSDAIALAVRMDAKIYVAEDVLEEVQLFKHEIDEAAQMAKFRELMENVDAAADTDLRGSQDPTDDPADEQSDTEDDQ